MKYVLKYSAFGPVAMKYVLKYLAFGLVAFVASSYAYANVVNDHVVELVVGLVVSGVFLVFVGWNAYKDGKALIAAIQRHRGVSEGS